jgi:CheY-like chemotaxis protein
MTRTILIVDDERPVVEFLSDLFEDEGFAVRRAYNGVAALHDVEIEPPDLVLSDIALPGLSGIELARRLTARAIPVVLMSAAAHDPRLPDVIFVAKPFALDAILNAARRVLARV